MAQISPNKIQELQMLEQQLQSSLMQRQSLQVEYNECSNALKEISETKGDVFKVLGGIMIKTDKQSAQKELEIKQKELNMKLSAFDKQEKVLEEKISKLQKEVSSELSSKN